MAGGCSHLQTHLPSLCLCKKLSVPSLCHPGAICIHGPEVPESTLIQEEQRSHHYSLELCGISKGIYFYDVP